MRAIKIMLFIVISSVMSSVYAQSYQDVKRAMTKASQVAVAGFRESRVSGMIEKIAECYAQLSKKMFYCSYIDIASRYIELTVSQVMGYSPSQFFTDDSFSDRMSEIFERANMDIDQANEYLSLISPEINELVDIELSK
ncbi:MULTISPECIES: hypothetical protein [Nitrosomonas]|uniref:Uncharacterized protein n=2 Tax=Nitrosomonas communis TaxID=44574 RepID=A0A0F7KAS5_9PROT|nr:MULTISPECIES: hypothetical protein [Nitrosomonas]AKH36661.1 hypothetical protein AAW31_00645 [Nitrosomonas communis]UVS61705.1 hypothetical protein NX761_00690 [Nitrosomonas sp. PLL12]